MPRDQFRSLVLRLLGDKDHEKIFDCVAKVEKHYRSRDRAGTAAVSLLQGMPGEKCQRFPEKPGKAYVVFLL